MYTRNWLLQTIYKSQIPAKEVRFGYVGDAHPWQTFSLQSPGDAIDFYLAQELNPCTQTRALFCFTECNQFWHLDTRNGFQHVYTMYVSYNYVAICCYSKYFKIPTNRNVASFAIFSFPLKKWHWFDKPDTVGLNNVSLFLIHPRTSNRWRLSCPVRHSFVLVFLKEMECHS